MRVFCSVVMAMAWVVVAVALAAIAVPARATAVEMVTASPIGAAWTALAENDDDQSACSDGDAVFGEEFAETFDGASDAFLRRLVGDAEGLRHLAR